MSASGSAHHDTRAGNTLWPILCLVSEYLRWLTNGGNYANDNSKGACSPSWSFSPPPSLHRLLLLFICRSFLFILCIWISFEQFCVHLSVPLPANTYTLSLLFSFSISLLSFNSSFLFSAFPLPLPLVLAPPLLSRS